MAKPKTEKYRKSNREWYDANRATIREKARKKYLENKEKVNADHREYYYKNKAHINKKFIDKYNENRDAFLKMYGGKCECCGETEKRFLALNHVERQSISIRKGNKRESGANSYRHAVKFVDKTRYNILCHNCNFATRYGVPCPHELQTLIPL